MISSVRGDVTISSKQIIWVHTTYAKLYKSLDLRLLRINLQQLKQHLIGKSYKTLKRERNRGWERYREGERKRESDKKRVIERERERNIEGERERAKEKVGERKSERKKNTERSR